MTVCFIGHRKIENKTLVEEKLSSILLRLVENGADTFLFGSRSDFDVLCWNVVSRLQEKYPNIKRTSCNAPHESAFLSREERISFEKIATQVCKCEIHSTDYESEVVPSEKSLKANKNAYIVRNQEMIDACDICVFYYDKNYLPPRRKQSKKSVCEYQPQSGTAIAYAYAKQKRKEVLNIFE